MFSADTLLPFIKAVHTYSTGDAALHGHTIFPCVRSDAVAQLSEELLRWLPSNVSAHLRRELLLEDSVQAASSKQLATPNSGGGGSNAAPPNAVPSVSQRGSTAAGQPWTEQWRVRDTTATAALTVLSVALRPLVQDSEPARMAVGSTPETYATLQVKCVCAVLLRLITSDLDQCHGTWAARESGLPPSLIIAGTVRQRLAASLKKWMQYFFLFFANSLHDLQSSMTPMPAAPRTPAKRPRAAAAASLRPTAQARVEEAGDDGPRKFHRGQAVPLHVPLRGRSPDFVRHPLHYYAQALQRAAESIAGRGGSTPAGRSNGDDDEPLVAAQSCGKNHISHSRAVAAVLTAPQRGAPLRSKGMARMQWAERRSGSGSCGAVPSSLAESPPLFCAFAPPQRQRSPARQPPNRCVSDCTAASVDDDVPLLLLAQHLQARTLG
ncbi:hypothetical protein LSCM1_02015 [Leishmania martiniquensis]|uniref:Uncharacterized protein n=1 Tax=Leishmania martiniquensis TaxID=1580590 RepID=A0A836KEC2_9TRYP|nr:hypothetical protein LSCM1_02015 [Leishmania martiniquensis]